MKCLQEVRKESSDDVCVLMMCVSVSFCEVGRLMNILMTPPLPSQAVHPRGMQEQAPNLACIYLFCSAAYVMLAFWLE